MGLLIALSVAVMVVAILILAMYIIKGPSKQVTPSRDPKLARSQDELLKIAEAYRAEASRYAAILQRVQSHDQAGLLNLDQTLRVQLEEALLERDRRERGLPKGDSD